MIEPVIHVKVQGQDVGSLYYDVGDDKLAEWHAEAERAQAEILALAGELKRRSLELGRLLHEFIKERDYVPLDFSSAEEWLASIEDELGFGPRWAWILRLVHQVYIEEMGLNPDTVAGYDFNKLAMIAPVVRQDRERWLGEAKGTSRSELRRKVRAEKALPPKPELFFDQASHAWVYLDGRDGLPMKGLVTWLNPGLSPENFSAWVEDAEEMMGRMK